MQFEKYTKEFRRLIKPLFPEKQAEINTRRCCVTLHENEISLLYLDNTADGLHLLLTETFKFADMDSLSLVLTGAVKKNGLEHCPTYWLLSPDDYQLLLIESLQVEKTEMRDALTWRIRTLINYPIDEAVIDYFTLPAKKSSPNSPLIAAVSAKSGLLLEKINLFKKCELRINTIDIPELALKNLTSLYEDDEKSTAFIYFYQNTAILNITRQKTLYFTRRLALSSTINATAKEFESIGLDILRYFDYFQSQWRYPSPTRVFVASEQLDSATIAKFLSEYLSLSVQPFSLKTVFPDNSQINSLQQQYLLTLGCAMREEGMHATTGN